MRMGLVALVSGLLCGSCGDFICGPATENPSSCPQDCPDLSDFCYVTPAD
ncbi:hypothetical protein [Corallococcus interemptor]|nr:hypothetical protein [Corallococcus interemptor]